MATLINNCKHHTITEDGVVTNLKTGKIKSTWVSKAGYYCVDIQEDGIAKRHYLHRLLATNFIPNPENKRTVNHIDGVKTNNTLANLEWATDSENIKHAYDNGLNYCSTSKVTAESLNKVLDRFLKGEDLTTIVKDFSFNLSAISQALSKYVKEVGKEKEFIEEKVRQKNLRAARSNHETIKVLMINKDSNTVEKEFKSISEATQFLNKKSSGPISNVLAGRQKTAYGYFWRRA